MVFRLFWILTRETCVFAGKGFGRVVKKTFDVSNGTLMELIFRMEVLKTGGFSKKFLKFSGQWWKNFSRVGKTAIDVRGNSLWKLFFTREKFALFVRFWANVYFQRKLSPELRNPQSMFPWTFLGKAIFEKYIISHTFFGLWSKKRLVVKKIFFQVVTTAIRTFRGIFWEKVIFLKKNLFVHLFWSLSNFSCLLTKNSQGVKETSY